MKTTLLFCLAPLVLLFASGCGDSDINRGGSLKGIVYIGDKPLGGGKVELFPENDKNSVSCEIGPDGSYEFKEPPLGKCKVVVQTSQLQGIPLPPKSKVGNKGVEGSSGGMMFPESVGLVYTPIPAKYEDKATSDYTITVEKGKKTLDIKLEK